MSEQIYLAVCEERHIDNVYRGFHTFLQAKQFCLDFMEENKHPDDDIEEEDIQGWEYYAVYSGEGDSVHIELISIED